MIDLYEIDSIANRVVDHLIGMCPEEIQFDFEDLISRAAHLALEELEDRQDLERRMIIYRIEDQIDGSVALAGTDSSGYDW